MKAMKTSRIAIVAALALLVGCEERKLYEEKRITVRVESVRLSTKTNSRVNLRDVNSKKLYESQRLSCSEKKAKKVVIGSLWDITEMTYVYPESKRFESGLVNVRTICEKSN